MKVSTWMLSTLLLAASGARAAVHQNDSNNGTKSTATITSPPASPTINAQGAAENDDGDTPSPYADYKSFTSAILNSTNTYRTQHDAPSLTWNATLASFASSWLSTSCKMSHSGGPYGENLAIGYPDPAAAVEAWSTPRPGLGGDRYDRDEPLVPRLDEALLGRWLAGGGDAGDLYAVRPRHDDVGQQQVIGAVLQGVDGVVAILAVDHLMTGALQRTGQETAQRTVVFSQKDARHVDFSPRTRPSR